MKLFEKIMIAIVQTWFKVTTTIISGIIYRVRYINACKIPKKGGYIIASNHVSYFDPPLIGTARYDRLFRFMARDTLFKSFFGLGIKLMGAFPVRRGAVDRQAWATFVELVKEGWMVMLFPEGTRTPDGEIHDGKPGSGMFIYKAKARVIPVYTHGLFDVWPKGQKLPSIFKKVDIIYGDPVDFSEFFGMEESKETYIRITEKLMARIRALKQEYMDMKAAKK